ncbi:nuclear transport factor 2 family protein [Streptomyces sp. NPDC006678]|uniref:nuclear transport factor 2 family protein n=1 Tax=Streptomyces sp. NPDC006678 TaxID=3157185 RepID=UPI00341122F9
MNPSEPWPKRVSVEHVYLSYAYLNARDYDAFASLLDEDVTLRESDGTAAFGRAAVTAAEESRRFTYVIEDLWGSAEKMVVTGIRRRPEDPCTAVDFAAIFNLSKCGLISSCRTYVAPVSADEEARGGARKET